MGNLLQQRPHGLLGRRAKGQSLPRLIEQPPYGFHLRLLQKVATHKIIAKLHDYLFVGAFLVVAKIEMGYVRANEHQFAVLIR